MNVFNPNRKGETPEIRRSSDEIIDQFEEKMAEHKDRIRSVHGQLQDAGYEYFDDHHRAFLDLPDVEYIVRRESVSKILGAIEKKSDYVIGFDENLSKNEKSAKYFNAALFHKNDRRGLKAAFTEGFAGEQGVSLVTGILPSADVSIEEMHGQPSVYKTHESQGGLLDRSQNRAVSGTVTPNDIAFIIMRFPVHMAPIELMSEKDEERLDDFYSELTDQGGRYTGKNTRFISRVYTHPDAIALFNQKREKRAA